MPEIPASARRRQFVFVIRGAGRRLLAHARTPSFAVFIGVYLAVVAWFKSAEHFDIHNTPVFLAVAHDVFRVLFVFYVFAIVYGAGAMMLRITAGRAGESIGVPEHLALGFLAGIGLWHMAMLVLGLLHLDRVWVIVAATLPAVAMAHLGFSGLVPRLRRMPTSAPGGGTSAVRPAVLVTLGAFAVIVGSVLLTPNGSLPAGGAGPSTLGVFLADQRVASLIPLCFMTAGALALFLLVRRFMAGTLWPWVAVTLFLGLSIYPRDISALDGAQGDAATLHDVNGSLIIGILWMTAGACERRSRLSLTWAAAAASAAAAAVIDDVMAAAYLGGIFLLLTLWHLGRGDRRPAIICVALAGVVGAMFVALPGLHSLAPGAGGADGVVAQSPRAFELRTLLAILRLDLLYPLVAGGLVVTLAALTLRAMLRFGFKRHGAGVMAPHQAVVLSAALLVLIAALSVAPSQPQVFFRYSSIGAPIMIAAGIWLWAAPFPAAFPYLRRSIRWWPAPVAVLAACLAVALATYPPGVLRTVRNPWRLSATYNIDAVDTAPIPRHGHRLS